METILGMGWAHSKTFSGTLRLGLEVMLHQQETHQQSLPECGECGTEAFSMCYPGSQVSGQVGEMGAQHSLGMVSNRDPEPSPQVPTGQIQATKLRK